MRYGVEIGVDGVSPFADRLPARVDKDRSEGLLPGARSLLGELERALQERAVAIGQFSSQRRNTTQALCPPNPNELETPIVRSARRASFGM